VEATHTDQMRHQENANRRDEPPTRTPRSPVELSHDFVKRSTIMELCRRDTRDFSGDL